MNTPSSWDDAHIHAYVDGELDAEAATRLEAESRADAALAARVARQRELTAMLRGAFDPVLDEPVPQHLRDALAAPANGTITPIGAARKSRSPRSGWSLREWSAVAATLMLGLMVGALAFRTPATLPVDLAQGRLLARGELATALSTQLSGASPAGAATRIGLSFRASDGAWCRSFSRSDGPTGLACRRDGQWAVQMLEDTRPHATGDAGEYRQAASSLSPSMLGAINALGGDDALTPDQEQQQLRAGWD